MSDAPKPLLPLGLSSLLGQVIPAAAPPAVSWDPAIFLLPRRPAEPPRQPLDARRLALAGSVTFPQPRKTRRRSWLTR